MLRTYEEIVEKCRYPQSRFSHDLEVYLEYLPFKYAKEFLIDHEVHNAWDSTVKKPVKEIILEDMKEYMRIAWVQAESRMEPSTSKSIELMLGWLWLLDDTELLKFAINEDNYRHFGAPILSKICEKYEFPIPTCPDVQNMIQGKTCYLDNKEKHI